MPSVTLLICAIAGPKAIAAMHAPASWSKRLKIGFIRCSPGKSARESARVAFPLDLHEGLFVPSELYARGLQVTVTRNTARQRLGYCLKKEKGGGIPPAFFSCMLQTVIDEPITGW